MSSAIFTNLDSVILNLAALDIQLLTKEQQAKIYTAAAESLGESPRSALDVLRQHNKRKSPKKVSLRRAMSDAMTLRALVNANRMYRTTVR